jgi:hypothetical protein
MDRLRKTGRRSIVFFAMILLLIAPGLLLASSRCEADILEDMGADLIAHFDNAIKVDRPSNLAFVAYGSPQIVPGGISGSALSLRPGQYLVLDHVNILDHGEGTMTMWIRPHWASEEAASHTFLFFAWPAPKPDYFVVSRGWWEPAGARITYFVLKDRKGNVVTNKRLYYPPSEWTHIVCTWKAGENGYARLYVNGFLSSEDKGSTNLPVEDTKLYVGLGNMGAADPNRRWADADIDDLGMFRRVLSDGEIYALYQAAKRPSREPLLDLDGALLETRAIHDEGIGWTTAAGALRTISRIKQAGFNVYVPSIWHGQGTRYPSAMAPGDPGISFRVDPLKRLIDIAHSKDIEVHPMFTVALRQRDFLSDYYDSGTPPDAFDLHRPQFRSFIADLIVDAIRRYDIDGVNLDYIRTMGTCTSTYCQSEYRREFGRDLLTDIAHPNPNDASLEPHLQKWQDDAVTAIVKDISVRGKLLRPGLIVSVDGHPLYGPNPEGREEVTWVNSGLIDVVFNMDYNKLPDYEMNSLVASTMLDPKKLFMIVANYDWIAGTKTTIPIDPQRLNNVVSVLQQRWPQGSAVYIYSMLSDSQIRGLSQGPFRSPAKPIWRKGKPGILDQDDRR